MKTKGLILLSVSIFLTISVQAQFKFGIKEGVTLSTQSELGMLWDNNNIKTGFSLGATMEYRIHPVISVQTELIYKTQGLAYDKNESSISEKVDLNYNYYNIPLLVKARFSDQLGLSDKWMVSFYTGPYYSYLSSAKNEIEKNKITTTTDYNKESNQSDWGLVFGGEVARIFNKGELFFDLRYDMGLSDVTINSNDLQNKVIGIGIGYRF